MKIDKLDRILGALNDVQPSARMESRLKARLEARQDDAAVTWRRSFGWMAVPVLAAAIVAAVVARHHSDVAPPTLQTNAGNESIFAAATPLKHTSVRPATAHAVRPDLPATPVHSVTTELDVAYLPSLAPPPAPLSQDELRLRQMARPRSPNMLAEVEPLREIAQREAAEADRHRKYDNYVEALLTPLVTSDHLQPQVPETPELSNSPDPNNDTNTTENQ